MVRLLQWLLLGHVHSWETLENNVLRGEYGATGQRFYLRCTCCGDVKKRDLI